MPKISITQAVAAANGDTPKKLSKVQQDRLKSAKMKEISRLTATYCRKCNQMMSYDKFWKTSNPYLDTNGIMSICINCANKMYEEFFIIYHDDKTVMFNMCQHLDIKYDEGCVSTLIAYFDREDDKIKIKSKMAKYLQLINSVNKSKPIRYCNTKIENDFHNSGIDVEKDSDKALKLKWGDRPNEEYEFLELKYKEYIDEYGAESPSEKDNFIQLSMLILRSRTDPTNKDVANAVREQFKAIGISPEQAKKNNEKKAKRTVGGCIGDLEKYKPADLYEDKERFFDHDNLEIDMKDLVRSQMNHMIGSRDFTSTGFDTASLDLGEDDE